MHHLWSFDLSLMNFSDSGLPRLSRCHNAEDPVLRGERCVFDIVKSSKSERIV